MDNISFLLKQKYCKCSSKTPACCPHDWKLCLVGSRFITPAKSRYAPIEVESHTLAYALQQTRYYTLGCSDLIVATDHEIDNRRLLNLKEKTHAHRLTITHVSGTKNKGFDAASCYPAVLERGEHPLDDPTG
ncbi:enzymatic polyprotein [Plakobranchus ocellatus]|uniref:Enzymatic polyprotein n=1 Tax=Plakobranchus ocellatus TaxID=259542 RepID=A0AAV4DST5_9GAST|nr:enzymatic polyprotein [Plakobranchus ocellatus]